MNSFINTSEFLKASPEQRTDMVMKGYAHIGVSFSGLAKDLKILSGWLKLMPGLLATDGAVLPDKKVFNQIIDDNKDSSDQLTIQLIETALLLAEMLKAIDFYKSIQK